MKFVFYLAAFGICIAGLSACFRQESNPTVAAKSETEASPPGNEAESTLQNVDPDQDLYGCVLDSQGRALAGAKLQLIQLKWRGNSFDIEIDSFEASRKSFKSNSQGEFKIPLLANQQYELIVSHGELASQRISSLYAGAMLEVVLQRRATFEGKVLADSDNAPIAGARIQAWNTHGRRVELFAGETQADGSFRFEGLLPGRVRVQVVAPSFATPREFTTELLSEKTIRHEFRCGKGQTVAGKVVDATTGIPIQGAIVGQDSAFLRSVQTNALGEFKILNFSQQGLNEVFVRAPGYGIQMQAGPSGPMLKDLVFKLLAARKVTGHIFRPDGEAAVKVSISAITAARPRSSDILNWYAGQVKSDGSFSIDGLELGGHYAIFVRSANYANVVYDLPPSAKQTAAFEFGVIHLAPPASLRGIVRDKSGKPMPGVWVRFGDHSMNAQSRFRFVKEAPETSNGYQTVNENYTQLVCRTDHLGRFTHLNLVAGPAILEVISDESYKASSYTSNVIHVQSVELKQGEDLTGLVVVVPL